MAPDFFLHVKGHFYADLLLENGGKESKELKINLAYFMTCREIISRNFDEKCQLKIIKNI